MRSLADVFQISIPSEAENHYLAVVTELQVHIILRPVVLRPPRRFEKAEAGIAVDEVGPPPLKHPSPQFLLKPPLKTIKKEGSQALSGFRPRLAHGGGDVQIALVLDDVILD